jgi:hypothetical protein
VEAGIQSRQMRRARRSCAVLVAGLLALGGCGGQAGSGPAPPRPAAAARLSPAHVALVERRVEALRGLRFRHPVPVVVVSAADARRLGLEDEQRANPPAARRAQEEVLELLGLLAPGSDLRRIAATVYGEQVAGYYDPRRGRLALVRGTGVDDVTLAHELTHALEDQHFHIGRLAGTGGSSDASTAAQALVEGTATEVMVRYAARYPGSGPSLGAALKALTASGTERLPPYVLRSLLFPYEAGARFVEGLLTRGGRDWTLVNLALRFRPPVSTAEVLQPLRWLRVQRPVPVRVAPAARVLGSGWRRVLAESFGEEDTRELLYDTSGAAGAAAAATGWRGGRLELWRRGALAAGAACAPPCRSRDALQLAWQTSDGGTAGALARALAGWLRRTLHARPTPGGRTWRLPDGSAAALAADGAQPHLALAPSATLATRLVRPPTAVRAPHASP